MVVKVDVVHEFVSNLVLLDDLAMSAHAAFVVSVVFFKVHHHRLSDGHENWL